MVVLILYCFHVTKYLWKSEQEDSPSVSGPKVDQVELERRRKAELERIRQERLNKIRQETEKLNTEISKTKAQIGYIDKHLSSLLRGIENTEEMEITIRKLNDLKSVYKDKLAKTLEINVPTEPDAISVCTRNLTSVTETIMASYSNEVEPLEERMQNFVNKLEVINTVTANSKDFIGEIEKWENIEDFDFTVNMGNVTRSDIKLNVRERAIQILSEIEEFVNTESIQESDMKDLLAIANNIYKTAFETENSFEAAAIEYNVIKPRIIKDISIFDDLYQDYFSEYIAYLELLNENRTEPIKITPEEKYRFSAIEELENEVLLLAKSSKALIENNYIREKINVVMRSFGYNLSEEIVFNNNQLGNHYICESESGKSAIHLHMSDGKRMMMEIVGIGDHVNRENESSVNAHITNTSELCDKEQEELLYEQGRFCELHPKIIEELEKYGLVFNKIGRCEPDLKYCRKINRISAGAETTDDNYKRFNERASERSKRHSIKEKRLAINVRGK